VSGRELAERVHTTEHQGVVATVDAYPYADVSRLLEECSLFVALDGIEDPHNLGAVVRSAEAAGAGVVIARHRAAEITAAVVKSSAGATEHAAIAQVRNLSDFLTDAKGKGFWIYGAAAGAESDYTTQDYKYPTCFVLGSEGRGLGRRVASLCDVIISMPLLGRVESLNVSVSAGILLYEALRQRRSSGENGRLPG
jgi:23S rRNA (guanosine2251-2'-O)-methyltransferase